MSVSPADFELYSRVTGRPMPSSPQEQMAMAPEVFNFTRNFGRGGYVQPQSNVLRDVVGNVGKLALLGLAGGAVQGLYRQQNPEAVNNSVSGVTLGTFAGFPISLTATNVYMASLHLVFSPVIPSSIQTSINISMDDVKDLEIFASKVTILP